MALEITVRTPALYPAQEAVIAARGRYNCLRPGRRWGKTELGIYLAIEVMIPPSGRGQPVGWFAPEYKYADEAWDRLVWRLGPLIKSANKTKGLLTLINGGSCEIWTLENNPDAGRSRKYKLAIVDEAGLVPRLRVVWDAAIRPTLIDLEGSAWLLGTPNPVGPDFDEMWDIADGGKPDSRQWRSFVGRTVDNPHLPNIIEEVENARLSGMPEWQYLQEYEGVPATSDRMVFPKMVLDSQRDRYADDPLHTGDLLFMGNGERDLSLVDGVPDWKWSPQKNPWKLWCALERDDRGLLRPPQHRTYAMGIDISAGMGASNSTCCVIDTETMEQVGEWASSTVSPEEFARQMAAAGFWWGGSSGMAFMAWEANGVGGVFGKTVVETLMYPWVYYHTEEGRKDRAPTDKFGWTSNRQRKQDLLNVLRAAMARNDLAVRSEALLDECKRYVVGPSGEYMPSILVDDGEARATHGDRVIGAGVAWYARERMGRCPPPEREAPKGTFEERKKRAQAGLLSDSRKWWKTGAEKV